MQIVLGTIKDLKRYECKQSLFVIVLVWNYSIEHLVAPSPLHCTSSL